MFKNISGYCVLCFVYKINLYLFIKESKHMTEYALGLKNGINYPTNINGKSLLDIQPTNIFNKWTPKQVQRLTTGLEL